MKTVSNPARTLVEGLLARCRTVSALVAELALAQEQENIEHLEINEKLVDEAEQLVDDIYRDISTLPGLTPLVPKSPGDKPADDATFQVKMSYFRSRAGEIDGNISAAQDALTAYLSTLPETVEIEEEEPRIHVRVVRAVPPPQGEHERRAPEEAGEHRAEPEEPRREERRAAETPLPPPPAAVPPKRERSPFSWGTLLLMSAVFIGSVAVSGWLFDQMSQAEHSPAPATAQGELPELPTSPVETPASTTPPTPAVSTPTPPTATVTPAPATATETALLDCAKAQVVAVDGGSYAVIPVHGGKSTVWVSEWAVAADNTCVRPNGSIVTEAAFTKLRKGFKDAIGNDAPRAGLTPPTLVGERLVRCQIGVGKLADCFE